MKGSVTWDKKLSVIFSKVKEVEYLQTEEFDNDWKNILRELGIEEDEDDDNNVEFQMETVDNEEML